ncbi:MAG: hypothetical protein E7598_08325 [Ruminococcaceae bacterium]|nr:hypothetical protein [Oscillospiraceae bacterium]
MNFFDDGSSNGGICMSKREIVRQIEDLYGKIDDENEKKEELLSALRRTECAIERFRELICDMEALLH